MEDTAQAHVYEDAQHCATLFREYCLQQQPAGFFAPDGSILPDTCGTSIRLPRVSSPERTAPDL